MEDMMKDVVRRAIEECGRRYGFDGVEACRELGVDVGVSVSMVSKKEKNVKVLKAGVSSLFPLPYNGEMNDSCCHGLKQNHGLYTQCQQGRKGDGKYCKGCNTQAEKNENGEPDYGSIESRMAVGIFEYVDPKGKKPTAYTKIMKKYKVSEEEVVAEAAKFNVTIDAGHFEVSAESKRGRPKTAVEKVSKGVKGRPKKSKKVVELCDDATDDLFADLVASANKDSDSESDVEQVEQVEQVQKVLAKAEAKEAEKLAKAEAKEAEKLAKEAEKLAKEQEKLAKEQEKLAKEQEKKAKAEAKEAEKLAKAAEKKAKADAKVATKEAKVATKEEKTADEEPDKVKRFEFEGVKYLKSKNTGIIYNMEQDVVGKWNEQSNKIDFKEAEDEEEEEEYEDE
jgi:hypothetical protein